MSLNRQVLMVTLAAALIATLVVVVVAPNRSAQAAQNQLWFNGDEGTGSVTLGPNEVLRIDGRLTYSNSCDARGVNDFVYPATDIYVMPAWYTPAEGAPLQDVMDSPNTIVSGLSVFIDEIVGITAPSGTLPEGDYSIVYDSCQDGRYDKVSDTIFANVLHVKFPFDMPPVDPAIQAVKSSSFTQFGSWKEVGVMFDRLLKVESTVGKMGCLTGEVKDCWELLKLWVDDPAIQEFTRLVDMEMNAIECGTGSVSACFGIVSAYWRPPSTSPRDMVTGGTKALIANMAKSFFGVYADPPRADFLEPSSARVSTGLPVQPVWGDGDPLVNATSTLVTPLEREEQMVTAFLAAVERYQGAQAAGDVGAALAQVRSARNLAAAMRAAAPTTDAALAEWFVSMRAVDPTFDQWSERSANEYLRWSQRGFDAEEIRHLRNDGLDGPGRQDAIDEIAQSGKNDGFFWGFGELDVAIASLLASRAAAATGLATTLRELDAMIAEFANEPDALGVPTVSAGGPYTTTTGTPVTLSATVTPPTAAVAWDVDGDGLFDDGTGATINPTFVLPGQRVVAVKATSGGHTVTGHALITIADGDRPPTITAQSPVAPGIEVLVGSSTPFSVTATDDRTNPRNFRITWWLDGEKVDGNLDGTYTFVATASQLGNHQLAAVVHDEHPHHASRATWVVSVTPPDADLDGWVRLAGADCDDTRTLVNPSQPERFGNNIDDDCNPATVDRPIDLGPGAEVWTWGHGWGSGTGAPSATSVKMLSDQVVEVAVGYYDSIALRSDGTVLGWGQISGDSRPAGADALRPGPVRGIGGQGYLGGVVDIAEARGSKFALLADGHLLSWGQDNGGQLGRGSILAYRGALPDYVVGPDTTGDGRPDPLANVSEIWADTHGGITTGIWARTSDGTIYQWGTRACIGGQTRTGLATPAPSPTQAILEDMVQVSASAGWTLFRMADGSVLSCGDQRGNSFSNPYDDNIRPFCNWANPLAPGDPLTWTCPFGPHNPAVDVDVHDSNAWYVVTADGSIWTKNHWSTSDSSRQALGGLPQGILTRAVIPPGARIIDVEAGGPSVIARRADGTALTWGYNDTGNVGRSSPGDQNCDPLLAIPVRYFCPGPLRVDDYIIQADVDYVGAILVSPRTRPGVYPGVPTGPWLRVDAIGATGAEGATVNARVELSDEPAVAVVVGWTFGDQTGTVTVPAGVIGVDVPITLPGDGRWGSPDAVVPFTLSSANQDSTIRRRAADVTITDSDPAPLLTLVAPGVIEGNVGTVAAPVAVTLSTPAAVDMSVTVATANESAVAGTDYKAATIEVPITAGDVSGVAPLAVFGDRAPEPDETIRVTGVLHGPSASSVATAAASLAIRDDDPVMLAVSSASTVAGGMATVEITAPDLPSGESVTVRWSSRSGTAVAGTDFTSRAGTATLTGDAAITVRVPTVARTSPGGTVKTQLFVDASPAATGGGRSALAARPGQITISSTPTPAPPAPPTPPPPAPTPPPPEPAPVVLPPGAARYVPLAPARLFDTRVGAGEPGPKGLVGPDASIDIQVAGKMGIPSSAVSVVMNVTATDTVTPGFVTVYPTGIARPNTSSINNIQPGQTRPNLVTVPLGADGKVTFYSQGTVNLLADIAGYYVPATRASSEGRFVALTPQRLFDTRPGSQALLGRTGRLAAEESIRIQVLGIGDVPASGVAAVVMNLTATDVAGWGFLTAYPTGPVRPVASNVNYTDAGTTAPNFTIVPVAADGTITVYTYAAAHVLGDVTGYITDSSAPASIGGLFVPIAPERVFDTRGGRGPVGADSVVDFPIAGTGRIPADAVAVALNVTGVEAAVGYLTAWPTGGGRPNASTLNFAVRPSDTRANAAMLPVGLGGRISFYTENGAHILADATGYFIGGN